MYCKRCGNYLENGSKYCGNCGCEVVYNNHCNVCNERKSNTSVILGILAILMLCVPFISIPLAIASIVVGVKDKKNNNRNVGIILGVIGLILDIIYIIVIVAFTFFAVNMVKDDFDDVWDWTEDYFEYEDSVDLKGDSYQVSDGGVIYFDNYMRYSWYLNDNNHSDNYILGTYEIYNGLDAIRYINDEYHIAAEDQYELFTKCYDGENCKDIDHYYLIVLESYYRYVDGVGSNSNDSTAYYGFYDEDDKYFDMKDIVTENEINFARVGSVSGNNTI